eukprot:scpid100386/ scgid6326/ 
MILVIVTKMNAEESVKFVLRKRKRVTISSLLLPVMLNPGFLGFVGSLPRKRRFWSAHADGDDDGVWEKEILGIWSRLGQDFQGVEDERFIEKFRVTKCTFLAVHDLVKDTIDCQTTHLRK